MNRRDFLKSLLAVAPALALKSVPAYAAPSKRPGAVACIGDSLGGWEAAANRCTIRLRAGSFLNMRFYGDEFGLRWLNSYSPGDDRVGFVLRKGQRPPPGVTIEWAEAVG